MLMIVPSSSLIDAVEHGIISVSFHMLLQILRTLESLATELAAMRFQGNMDSDVRSDVIALDNLNAAVRPRALQVEIVGAFAANMFVAYVILELSTSPLDWGCRTHVKHFRGRVALPTTGPQASEFVAMIAL